MPSLRNSLAASRGYQIEASATSAVMPFADIADNQAAQPEMESALGSISGIVGIDMTMRRCPYR